MSKIDTYLCGEELEHHTILPQHYEYFFDEKKLMKVLFALSLLLIIGGIAWL